jgi:hypothetical protein
MNATGHAYQLRHVNRGKHEVAMRKPAPRDGFRPSTSRKLRKAQSDR